MTSRSRALDAWDYRAPFARWHIEWGEADDAPAFEQMQAYGIAVQELKLEQSMEILAHREVLVSVASEHLPPGTGRAPVWVVMVVGRKREDGGGVVMQALIHARSGEILLGTTVPVRLGGA